VLVNIKSVSEHLMLLTSSLGVSSSRFITKLNSLITANGIVIYFRRVKRRMFFNTGI
jgi:hypothetical protein